jgi:hypothetical protein
MKNEMIYVVELGENAEGAMRMDLHATREGAQAKALSWIAADQTSTYISEWREVAPFTGGGILAKWEGGCDYIIIYEKKIEG